MSKGQQKVYEILKDARDLLAQGWVQGIAWATDVDGTECYCATGAIREACMGAEPDKYRPKYFQKAVSKALGTDTMWADTLDWTDEVFALQHWNDEAERTKEEVLKAFDKAIENLEKELSDD